MLYFSKGKKVAHFEGCHHKNAIKKENLCTLESVREAKEKGLRLCKCCNPVIGRYRKEKKELIRFCAQNGLICLLKNDILSLQSIHSKWKLVPTDEGRIALYHKNNKGRRVEGESLVPGYHLQNAHYRELVLFCNYVIEHDAYRMRNPLIPNVKRKKEKKPAKKGSGRWFAEQERAKKRERRAAIRNVYSLFEQIEAARAAR